MAKLVAEFSADAASYEAAIQKAAKSLDELPRAAASAQLRLKEIAAKGANDAVQLREAQVLKELQSIEGIVKKAPALYEQAEKAKTDIVKKYAQERIDAANSAGAAETKGFSALRDGAEKAHHSLREVLMFSNALGESFDVGKSAVGKFAKEALGAFAVGGPFGIAFAAGTTAAQALIDKIEGIGKAAREQAEQFDKALRKITGGLAEQVDKGQEELRSRGFTTLGGTEKEYKDKVAKETGAGQFEAAQAVLQRNGGNLTTKLGEREELRKQLGAVTDPDDPRRNAGLRQRLGGKIADLDKEIGDLQDQYAVSAQALGSAYQLANPPADYQGAPTPSYENGGIKKGKSPEQQAADAKRERERVLAEFQRRADVYKAQQDSLFNLQQDQYLSDPYSQAKKKRDEETRKAGQDSDTAGLGTDDPRRIAAGQAAEKRYQEAVSKIALEESKKSKEEIDKEQHKVDEAAKKEQEFEKRGMEAAGGFLRGFKNIIDGKTKDPREILGTFLKGIGGIFSLINPVAGAGISAVSELFRDGGGAWTIPQGRSGLGAGINHDARLTHFDHPGEFKWSAAGVAGAGGPDGVAALHAAAREGRLGEAMGRRGGGDVYVSALTPQDAVQAIKQAVAPGVTRTLSNAQSGVLAGQMRQAVQAPRSR